MDFWFLELKRLKREWGICEIYGGKNKF